jgi:murein tripeptide amidase MpaA
MKTTFKYDHYYKYDELEKNLKYFASTYPELCSLESICVTEENRNVYAMTITNSKTGVASSKPAFHIDGNTHAGEVTGSMAAMHAIDVLLTGYGEDSTITSILDRMTIYVVPRISPDGAETYLTTPYSIRSVNRVHNPEDGGVRSEDLDNDGVIRSMRIPTPYGAWKKDKDDPSIMVKRDPGDAEGEYYDIYPEGIFECYPGDENLKKRKEDWSLDFNRNYPFGWFPENRQPGAGKYPLSNPETKAMADWIIEHPNIGGVSTNHTSGGIILYPPGTKASSLASHKDIKQFKEIAEMGKQELGYEPLNIYDSFIADPANYDSGAFDDWCYQSQGIVAYTVELWDLANRVGVPQVWNARNEEDPATNMKRYLACMKWVKENAPQYYEDWKPYHHEKFGDVEIGGFNFKFTHQNPPENFLNGVMEQMTRFMLRFAQSMPRLTVDTLEKEEVSEGVYKITAIVGNLGYLPTNLTELANELRISKPVEVRISGAKFVTGLETTKIGNLEGYGSTKTGVVFYGNISTMENAHARKKLTWVVKASKGTEVTITASQEKSGVATKTITL